MVRMECFFWNPADPLTWYLVVLCPVINVSEKLQHFGSLQMGQIRGQMPCGRKVCVSPLGKRPRPDEVIVVNDRNLK